MPVPNVIAVSRQFGAGGAWVGREVARRLGLKYADREILAEAARALNVETDQVAPLEERVRGFWERLAGMFAQGSAETPFTPPPLPTVSEEDLFAAEHQIVETIAAHGHAVIVGRGAAHLLRGRPEVLRVFLHGPLPWRVATAMDEYGLTDQEEATSIVRASDAQRARFARSITGRDWYDATLYDLCVDTGTTGLQGAADLIVQVVEHART